MGRSGHCCSRVLILTPLPHIAAIRLAKTEGSMKRSPMIAMVSDIDASRAQGGEPLPERARSEPCLDIGRKHLLVTRSEAGIGGLRLAEMGRHPVVGTGGHVRIASCGNRRDHRRTSRASLLPTADTNVRIQGGSE